MWLVISILVKVLISHLFYLKTQFPNYHFLHLLCSTNFGVVKPETQLALFLTAEPVHFAYSWSCLEELTVGTPACSSHRAL